jgi:NAD(P)H-dependent flavin oxidoreductase YrpB (nitropropane dioxygenase family)
VPQVVDAVKVLVIATGGISDARGIVAALALTTVLNVVQKRSLR